MARNRNALIFLFLFSFAANIFHGTEGASKDEIKSKLESIEKSIDTIYTMTFSTTTSATTVKTTAATKPTVTTTAATKPTVTTTAATKPTVKTTTATPKLRRQRRSVALWQDRLAQVAEGDTDGCGSLNSTECYKNAVKLVNGELENIKNKKYGEVKIENLNEADKKLKELASKTIDSDLKTYVHKNKDQIDDLKENVKKAEDVVDSSARTISGGVVGVLAGIALLLL